MKTTVIPSSMRQRCARACTLAVLFIAGFLLPAAAQIPWPLNPTNQIHRIFAGYGNYDDGVQNGVVTGMDIHFHEGLDILPTPGVANNNQVIACEDGVVGSDPFAIPELPGGNNADGYLRHILVTRGNSNTEALVYMHCNPGFTHNRNLKKNEAPRKWQKGDAVRAGDLLGTIAVRPALREHLHFGWQSKKAAEQWTVGNNNKDEYAGNPIDILDPIAKNNRPVVDTPIYMTALGAKITTRLYNNNKTTVLQGNVDIAARMYDRFGPNGTDVYDINVKKVEWFAGLIDQCACNHVPTQTPIHFTGKFLAAQAPDKGRNFNSKFHTKALVHTIYCDKSFAKSAPRNVRAAYINAGVYYMYLTNIDQKNDSLETTDAAYYWNTRAKEGFAWNAQLAVQTADSNKTAATPDGRYRIGITATGHAGPADKTDRYDTVFINNFNEFIYSCSGNGTLKDTFCKDDPVYIKGKGFPKFWTFKVYVIKHQAWPDGAPIPANDKRVAMAEVTTDENGWIKPTMIWSGYQPNGMPDQGYEIVLDYNDDGLFSRRKLDKVVDPIDVSIGDYKGITGSTLKATSTRKHVSCFGQCDGKLTVVASGGKPPYTYNYQQCPVCILTPGPNVRDKLCAGYYYTQVVDANGCTFDVYDTITEPAKLTLQKTAVNATCAGKCDGKISLTAAGGTPPYTYTPGQHLTGLCAGWVKFSVKDKNGCIVNDSALITEPAALHLNVNTMINTANGTCAENCNGSYTAYAAGGTPPYTYSPAQTMTGLCPGSYSVSVTDSSGCTSTATVIVSDTAGRLSVSAASTNIDCHGACTGTMYATATGGAAPYFYWPAQTLTGLCAGTHTITVTDANGCTRTVSTTITEPAAPLTISGTATSAVCGLCDGSVSVTASGGTGPYTYSPAQTMTGLCPGSYTVSVTDSSGCTSSTTLTVGDSASTLEITATSTDVDCHGACTGTMYATATGGAAPYSYWPAQTLTGLCPGTHTITVTDANGCTQAVSATITEPAAPLTISGSASNATCGLCNGSVSATASGGTGPYTYSPAQTMSELCPGSYTVSVTDNNGCTSSTTLIVSDTVSTLDITATSTDIDCNGECTGTMYATATGGAAPYSYWPAQTLTGLCAGTHTITVTDANGCTQAVSATITEPSVPLTISTSATSAGCSSCNGSVSATASGGTPPYTYSPAQSLTGLCAGTYSITVTDARGCSASASETVGQDSSTILVSLTGANANCNACSGSVSASASGGTPPYTYSPAQTMSNLCPGTYTITATDANGCTGWGIYTVAGSTQYIYVGGTVVNDSCGTCRGSLTAHAYGGTPPYTFSPAAQLTGICAGNYFITVTDANNCTGSGMFTVQNFCDTIITDTVIVHDTLEIKFKSNKPAGIEMHIRGVHPNPFRGYFTAALQVAAAGTLRYQLMTADGKIVLQQTVPVHKGVNNITIREKNPLPPGPYIFEMRTGSERVRKIIIRQ